MKHKSKYLTGLFGAVLTVMLIAFGFTPDENSPVHWIKFEEAVEKAKKDPKPIMIDIYTKWCGPCKLMSKNTFGNKQVADYLNKNFYCVKFDAECFDTVKLASFVKDTVWDKGEIKEIKNKPYTFTFTNFAAPGTPKSPHQFAYSILDGKLQYPSIVFLSAEINRLDIKAGYYPAQNFEPVIKFYGSGAYKTSGYEEFLKTFTPEITGP